jgi:putative endonuclease
MVECTDGSLYCGIAINVSARVEQHNAGKLGARYTRSRRPVKLVYIEPCGTRSDALKREIRLKKLSRPQKNRLIEQQSRVAA